MTGQLIITVEAVTPIFLGGAQAGQPAETIRPASIRGQVRYWLRAILGAGIDPNVAGALEDLKAREGALMGDTEAGSPVRFRIRAAAPLQVVEKQGRDGGRMMLPHRAVNQGVNALVSDAFIEDQRFDLILSPRPGRSQIPDEVIAATLLWLHLGGLGKRARRGFGSLQPLGYRASAGVVTDHAGARLSSGRPTDAAALRDRIDKLLNWLGGITPQPPKTGNFPTLSAYPVLHEDVAGVRVSDAVSGYGLTGYYEAMVPFWKESLRNSAKGLRDDRAYGYAEGNARRASPFHLHIGRSDAGYHQVFTTFWSEPPPDGDPAGSKVGMLLADVETKFGAKNLWGRPK